MNQLIAQQWGSPQERDTTGASQSGAPVVLRADSAAADREKAQRLFLMGDCRNDGSKPRKPVWLLFRHHFHSDFGLDVLVDPDGHLVGTEFLDRVGQQDHAPLHLNALVG